MTRRAPRTSFPPDPRSPGFRDWLYSLWQQVSRAGQILISQLSTSEVTANQVLISNTSNTSIVGKNVLGTAPVSITINTSNLTWSHDASGITAGQYGAAGSVPQFNVNVTGHITTASNVAIAITSAQVTDFNEAAQDAVGGIVTVSGNVPLTYSDATPAITADLSSTGVTAGTYGSATAVGQIVVDAKGRITSASNVSISLTSGSITDFNEAAQDAVGTILTGSGNVPLTYSDSTPSVTADLSASGVTAGSYGGAAVVGTFTVDAAGRLTAAANTAISIASGNVTDFTEAAQDAAGAMVLNSGNVPLTYTDATPQLAADLSSTGVSAATYGNATHVAQIAIDAKGRATSASNVAISITSSGVSDFTEAAQDAVGAMVVGTGNVTLTYTDATPALAAELSTTGVTGGSYGNATNSANITVDAKGRITAASAPAIAIAASQITAGSNNDVMRVTSGAWGNVALVAGANVTITHNTNNITIAASGSGDGSGDVTGPGSSTDNAVARFDGTGGKTLQNSAFIVDDSGYVTSFGGQIKFPATQAASADANTLDDYEEGTWTPNLGGTETYNLQIGRYTKIGRTVAIQMRMEISTIGTGSTTTISGLPFTAENTYGLLGVAHVCYFTGLSTNLVYLAFYISPNTTTFGAAGLAAAGASMTAALAIFQSGTSVAIATTYVV